MSATIMPCFDQAKREWRADRRLLRALSAGLEANPCEEHSLVVPVTEHSAQSGTQKLALVVGSGTDKTTSPSYDSLRRESLMQRFHFNAHTGDQITADEEGEILSGIQAAQDEARALAREMFANSVRSGNAPPDRIVVTDNDSKTIFEVVLADFLPKASP